MAFTWWGTYRIILKTPCPGLTLPDWLITNPTKFKVISKLDNDGYHFLVQLVSVFPQGTTIYKYAYPAFRSLARLEPAKAWFHMSREAEQYCLKIVHSHLKQHCTAIAIVTKFSPLEYIEIPMDEFNFPSEDEIKDYVNQAYSNRKKEIKLNKRK